MRPRLKSLELQGYKTFASRTLFEFPGTITAIVGPNGSGKSNVSDSLRWVLGEQSYSLLRGRKTEDMIFSGSEQRPKAGMASSSITFDNEDGWLPIDFTEVSITRRAYRDGENEYLLNNQRVRLKDISELLSQSGLSERTYTIIGQGLVDAALSLKPEERRKFFEEAAGIGLYRSRREESLNRLDVTRRNIERVVDILGELEPRLRSLEKQAKKAQEYDRIKADLRILLRDWYGFHWSRSQNDLRHAQEVLKAQETKTQGSREKLAQVDVEITALRESINKIRLELNENHSKLSVFHDEWQKNNRQQAILEERQKSAQDQCKSAENENARLLEEERILSEKLDAIEQERKILLNDLEEARREIAASQKEFAEIEAESKGLERLIQTKRQALVNVQTSRVQKNARLNELENRQAEYEKNVLEFEKNIKVSESELANSEKLAKNILLERESSEAKLLSLRENVSKTRKLIDQAEVDKRTVVDMKTRKQTELARKKAQFDVLVQAERSFSGIGDGVRSLLTASKAGKLNGKLEALNQYLQVSRDYEVAIAAVLGDLLEGLVTNNSRDLDGLLKHIEKENTSRAAILTKAWLQNDQDRQSIQLDGHSKWANEVISVDGEFGDVIQKFLERIIITDDREQAYSLISKAGYGYKVVTKAGEVFDSNGSIYAGKVAKIAILSRSREKREITEEIGGLEADCVQFDEQVNSFDEKIKKLRTDLNTATDTLRKLEIEHGDISKRYQQATLNHEQAVRKFDWQREQLQISVNRKTDLVQEMSSLRLEIEKQDGDIAGFNKELKKLNIDLLNLPINELREKVNHWKTTEAVASRGFKEIELRYQEVNLSQQKNLETHKIIDRRIQELLAQQEKLEMEKKEILNTLTGLNLEIEALGKQIEPAESALRNYELEYASLQQTQSSAQQVNTVAERYYNQAQLDMMRQRESLENLRKKIEDDFGLVAFEYATDVSGPNPLPIEGMVEMLPELAEIPQDLEDNIARQRALLRRIGPVNLEAQTEYQDVKERFDFLTAQISDLRKAETDLRQVIFELDELMRKEFKKTFNAVAAEFKVFFTRLFGGGSARLILTDEENPTETGIDIEARLPGRREQGLSLLSGGERSLTAVALVFSLLKVSPTPFCVLDEVDAMLDEANVGRFCDLLKELSATTQFIVITHNRNTVQAADVIYGVTMGRDSASQMISLKLDEVSEDMVR